MSDMTIQPNEEVASAKPYISVEEYLEKYADKHYEWVNGEVFEISPITMGHELLVTYLKQLFSGYFEINPIGLAIGDPFVMQLDIIPAHRQPDLQIILQDNLKNLTPTAMVGASDICIEVVSPASVITDYDIKFDEYEKGGVKEYWILDPKRRTIDFHRLNADGIYEAQQIHVDDTYKTPLLPNFVLHIPTLWREKLPATLETADIVRAMFKGD
ncbi:MAG TPA: Uma2 family endonuclease [Aggregatilineales bacterium]|nr:Uma2 family endonuclease [Aggregatilineales bacterium]